MIRTFDINVDRNLCLDALGWPEHGEAGPSGEDAGFGGNRSYTDLRRMPWSEAHRIYAYESDLIARISSAEDPDDEYYVVEDELYEDPEGILGLDIGVASAVVALSAARCIPFSSCNAGAFGGDHHETYPLVAFYARPAHAPLLIKYATKTDCGLENGSRGCVVLYAANVENIRKFAAEVISQSNEFGRLNLSIPRNLKQPSEGTRQLKLL